MRTRTILVTGSTGQIGAELGPALKQRYGKENVVIGGHSREPSPDLKDGIYEIVDVTNYEQVVQTIKKYGITHIVHLAGVLSAAAEKNPQLAYKVNVEGVRNVLEAARLNDIQQVFIPSSIAVFGPATPKDNTPNETILNPTTWYGIAKVNGELWGQKYFETYGLDVRQLRYPGIISWKEEPLGGTTDWAVQIYYAALRLEHHYSCYLRSDTALPMAYMPDAIEGTIQFLETPLSKLKHHTNFNLGSMSLSPPPVAEEIRKHIKGFTIDYDKNDPVKQAIADSWIHSVDDSAARKEWGWNPRYDLPSMTRDMIEKLRRYKFQN